MSVLHENLNIIVTIASAVGVYFMIRNGAKKDINELRDDTCKIKKEMGELLSILKNIDQRLSRLEGEFSERGRWEAAIKIKNMGK